jgi:hypothetical protein
MSQQQLVVLRLKIIVEQKNGGRESDRDQTKDFLSKYTKASTFPPGKNQ